jgi:hypothetical protein
VTLDIATLFAVTVFTTGVGGALLLFAWVQSRGTTALAWWGAAFLLFAPASALFGSRGLVADIWSIELANTLMLLAYGLLWTGGRVFEGRKPLPLWAVAGAIAWLVASPSSSAATARPSSANYGSDVATASFRAGR